MSNPMVPLATGYLMGLVVSDMDGALPSLIHDAQPISDAEGQYTSSFRLRMSDGVWVRVSVAPDNES